MTKLTKAELDCAWAAFVAHSPCYGTSDCEECWDTLVAIYEARRADNVANNHRLMKSECDNLIDEHRRWVAG